MPWLVTPLAVSGSVSPVAPSSRMPAALYLSMRVLVDPDHARGAASGTTSLASAGAVTEAIAKPSLEPLYSPARGVSYDVSVVTTLVMRLRVIEPCASRKAAGLGVDAAAVDRDAGKIDRQQALLGRVGPFCVSAPLIITIAPVALRMLGGLALSAISSCSRAPCAA